jgi:hypothetical protein
VYINHGLGVECGLRREASALTLKKRTASKAPPVKTGKAYRGDSVSGKLTPAVQAKFLEHYGAGKTVEAAATEVGVSRIAIFKLFKRDSDFATKFVEARDISCDVLEDKLLSIALNGHVLAIFGILRARRPAVWRENMKVEHSGNVSFSGEFAAAMQQVHSGHPATTH